MKEFSRKARLDVQVLRELAILVRDELTDPRLDGVTLTRVDVAPDLRNVKVFVSVMGDDEAGLAPAVQALKGASGRLRKGLGRNLKLRLVPDLHFQVDTQLREADRLNALIREAVVSDRQNAQTRKDAEPEQAEPEQ